MTRLSRSLLSLAFAWLALVVVAAPLAAQTITTGNLTGTVTDQQGGLLPGATVTAVHAETGATYSTITNSEGRFSVLNVRVGAYSVKATMSGFKELEQKDIVVALGEERAVNFKLELATVAETLTVTAEAPPIDTTRAGTGGNIDSQVKELLPTIARSLTDVVRSNSYFIPTGFNEDTPSASVAGRSQRYNNLQIDGAMNNDLFGLASSAGVPGGNAGTQPISLDAIREIQLVVSPYDIRQSGFSGGGVNAITKSGSNTVHGTAFLFGRNQAWVGDGVTGVPIATFKDKQFGGSIGGPIVENKAFYFGTIDYGRKSTPSGFSVSTTGVTFGNEASVDRFLDILKNRYGYGLGPTAKDEFTRTTDSNKIFLRADFNLSSTHQLTVRHNYIDAFNDVGQPSATSYRTPDGFYRFASKTNSTVAQLTSRFGAAVNEFRFASTLVREKRKPQEIEPFAFPFVQVRLTSQTSPTIQAGRENFSHQNELDQTIFEITNDYTTVRGNHAITIGTHNEFFKIRNLFIRDNFGNYTFTSLDNFEAGFAQGFDHSYSLTDDPLQAANFRVQHYGAYAGDQWRWRPTLTLTYGGRVDFVRFPDKPTANPITEPNFGYRTDIAPNNILWSPRVGFNWARKADASEQVRGGLGLFSGRPPYVWISNQFGATGVDFQRITASVNANNRIPFVSDANNQPEVVTGAPAQTNEIDLIDPEFKYPSILRGNLAYDRKLPMGWYGTAELLFSNVVEDIKYQNLNLVQVGNWTADGRPIYTRSKVPTLSNVLLLTNTSEGDSWSINFEAKRPFKNGFFINMAYLYGQANSVVDGTRDQAASVFGGIYIDGDPNNPRSTRSDFDPGHRITISSSYDFQLGKGYSATASVFYSGSSGRPYTLSFNNGGNSANGDGQQFNDNLYLPTATDQLTYTGGTYQDLLNFFNTDECMSSQIGQIMERNSCRSPWSNTMDARFTLNLPFRRVRAEITLDVLNLINLFNSSNGQFRYANFNQITVFGGTVTNNQLTGMNLANLTSPTFSAFTRSDLRSRWQLQLGARLRF